MAGAFCRPWRRRKRVGCIFFLASLIVGVLLTTSAQAVELYRERGRLASVEACLSIAGEAAATKLAEKIRLGQIGEETPISLLLDNRPTQDDEPERQHAFSVLWLCAHLVSAWETLGEAHPWNEPLPESGSNDPVASGFDRTHQALVVSFSDSQLQRLQLPPGPLARLLATPQLLPPAYVGGLVIKDAVISGPLLLNHVTIRYPITFANVMLQGGDYAKGMLGEPPTKNRALTMLGVRFGDQLYFSRSTFCGDVLIMESRFAEPLRLQRINQMAEHCPKTAASADTSETADDHVKMSAGHPTRLDVINSKFDFGFTLVEAFIGQLLLNGSHFETLNLAENNIGKMSIDNNDIGTLHLVRTVIEQKGVIVINRIRSDLWLDDQSYASRPDFDRVGSCCSTIVISHNKIDGGLVLKPDIQYITAGRFLITNNVVGNGSEIQVPLDWAGTIDFEGTKFSGELKLYVSKSEASTDTETRSRDVPLISFCPSEELGDETSYRSDGVLINLSAVEVKILRWDLPLTCTYRWRGDGFRYASWLRTDDAGDVENLQIWRQLLAKPQIEPLKTIAGHLTDQGHFAEGRQVMMEAKRMNFVPLCQPDWGLKCLTAVTAATWNGSLPVAYAVADNLAGTLFGSANVIADDGRPAAEQPPLVGDLIDGVTQLIALVLMWPAGYGADPLRALLLLAFSPIAFYAFYRLYSAHVHRRVKRAISTWHQAIGIAEHAQLADEDRHLLEEIKREFALAQKNRTSLAPDVFDQLVVKLVVLAERSQVAISAPDVSILRSDRRGNSDVPGFSQFDRKKVPTKFTLGRYSIDSMLPVIDLHAYSRYYAESWPVRGIAIMQHICGWWWSTVFIAAVALL
jgi:hypothetical protein